MLQMWSHGTETCAAIAEAHAQPLTRAQLPVSDTAAPVSIDEEDVQMPPQLDHGQVGSCSPGALRCSSPQPCPDALGPGVYSFTLASACALAICQPYPYAALVLASAVVISDAARSYLKQKQGSRPGSCLCNDICRAHCDSSSSWNVSAHTSDHMFSSPT